jgi:hypothetical protein
VGERRRRRRRRRRRAASATTERLMRMAMRNRVCLLVALRLHTLRMGRRRMMRRRRRGREMTARLDGKTTTNLALCR